MTFFLENLAFQNELKQEFKEFIFIKSIQPFKEEFNSNAKKALSLMRMFINNDNVHQLFLTTEKSIERITNLLDTNIYSIIDYLEFINSILLNKVILIKPSDDPKAEFLKLYIKNLKSLINQPSIKN